IHGEFSFNNPLPIKISKKLNQSWRKFHRKLRLRLNK
ncbi:unnamed protein product, partial [marine sediment metagenome]